LILYEQDIIALNELDLKIFSPMRTLRLLETAKMAGRSGINEKKEEKE
jgi:hypothetical protein